MKKLLLLLCMSVIATGAVYGQSRDERVKRSEEILLKTRKIDMLNQILPVALTKRQLSNLMAALEKVKASVEKQEKLEYSEMLKLEPELDAAIKAGVQKGELPERAFVTKLSKTFRALDIARQMAIADHTDIVRKALKEVLNAGQLKAAANAIEPTFFDPSLKPEELTQDKKLDLYVKYVLLDPAAYIVLGDLYKAAKD